MKQIEVQQTKTQTARFQANSGRRLWCSGKNCPKLAISKVHAPGTEHEQSSLMLLIGAHCQMSPRCQ